jgi:hypothetical protein
MTWLAPLTEIENVILTQPNAILYCLPRDLQFGCKIAFEIKTRAKIITN